MARSRVKGERNVRRLLRRIPDELRQEIQDALEEGGQELLATMRRNAPRGKTGRLVSGLSMKLLPRTLRLRVGYIGRAVNRRLAYANVLHWGRGHKKPMTKMFVRRLPGGGTTSPYAMKITRIPANRYVLGPPTDLMAKFNAKLKGVWERVLARAARGGSIE